MRVIPREQALKDLAQPGMVLNDAAQQLLRTQSKADWLLDVDDLSELEDWVMAYWPYGVKALGAMSRRQELENRLLDFLRTAPCACSLPVNIRFELADEGYAISLDMTELGVVQPLLS